MSHARCGPRISHAPTHPKQTGLVTEGLHPELVGHSCYTHAVSNWWGSYPDSPVDGFRQGAPPPFFPLWPCSAMLYSSRARGVGPFLFTSLNFRCLHNCHHHRRQNFVAFSSFWGGHVLTPTPPSGFKGQASQAVGR
jgi:hypothetical protein